jgi:hypothetical protein
VGRSLTSRRPDRGLDLDPAGLVVPAVTGPAVQVGRVGLAVTGLVVPGDRLDLDQVGRAVTGRAALVDPVDLDPAAPVDRAARAGLDLVVLVDLGLVGREDLAVTDLVDPVDPDPVDRAARAGLDLVVPVGRADLAVTGPAVPVGRVGLAVTGLVDPVDLAGRVDRHRRRTRPTAPTIGVALRWAAPGMRLTASARPTTVRRLRPHNTDSAGMVGLHPERRRLSGRDRRPRAAGTVHRLPGVGTRHGVGRRAT